VNEPAEPVAPAQVRPAQIHRIDRLGGLLDEYVRAA
jgi:hypothetical protein